MDGRVPSPRNTLLHEADVSARLSKKGSLMHYKLVADPNSRYSLFWYMMVMRPCDRSRRSEQQRRLEEIGQQSYHEKGRE